MRCWECGQRPARLIVRDRRICGPCWHRGRVLMDLARRLQEWRKAVAYTNVTEDDWVVAEDAA